MGNTHTLKILSLSVAVLLTFNSSFSFSQNSCESQLSSSDKNIKIQDKSDLFEFVAENSDFDFFSFSTGSLSGFKNGKWYELGSASLDAGAVKVASSEQVPSILNPLVFSWKPAQAAVYFKATKLKDLTDTQRDAFTLFAQGRLDKPMNLILRQSEKVETLDQAVRDKANRIIPILNEAFVYATPLPLGLTLYRGVSNHDIYGPLKAGDVFTDKGYISTSTSESVAIRFANLALRKQGVEVGTTKILVIRISTQMSQGHYIPDVVGSMFGAGESEVLLKPGQTFKVVRIDETKKADGGIVQRIILDTVSAL